MIPQVQTLPPNPPQQPMAPPGVPPAPAASPPPQSGVAAGGVPGAQPSAPPVPTDQAAGTGPAPGDPEATPDGEPRPRLIPGTDAQSGDVPASRGEEADLRQAVTKALYMIHGRQSRDAVLSSMHNPNETISQAVGRTAAHILMTVEDQKKASGAGPIDHEVLKEAASYVLPELLQVGISAGLFNLRPPAGEADGAPAPAATDEASGPGVGTDAYNKVLRMAMLEATKVYGEKQLQGPNAKQLTEQAQNDWARGVAQEVQDGTASPQYMKMVGRAGQQQAAPQLIPQEAAQ